MRESNWKLRISTLDETEERRDRALLVIDSLAAIRPVGGDGPWVVAYAAADASEVFALCAEELDAIDPRWVEVLDFVVLPDRSMVWPGNTVRLRWR